VIVLILKANVNYATQWCVECVSYNFNSLQYKSNIFKLELKCFSRSHIERCQAFNNDYCWFEWDLYWKNLHG